MGNQGYHLKPMFLVFERYTVEIPFKISMLTELTGDISQCFLANSRAVL
jgi:hypothetical protein